MKYFIENVKTKDKIIELEDSVVTKIQLDYIKKTYYWSVAFLCTIIGFLLGVIAS